MLINNNVPRYTVLASAHRAECNAEYNERQHHYAMGMLDIMGIPYTEVVGVYKGTQESSLLIVPNSPEECREVTTLFLHQFSQECVLMRRNDAVEVGVFLIHKQHKWQKIGERIAQVPPAIALKEDNYTIRNGAYYVVR